MKPIVIVFILFFALNGAHAQIDSIVGVITDDGNNGLAYVNVGVKGKAIGSVSNLNGRFVCIFNKESISLNDTFIVSKIGYESKKYAFQRLLNSKQHGNDISIMLQSKTEWLDEVEIIAQKSKSKTIGSKGRSLLNMYVNFAISKYKNQNLGSEIGRYFDIPRKGARLNSCSFFLSHNSFDSVTFRINIYGIKKGKPDNNLLQKEILVEVLNAETGWIDVDLREYGILAEEDIVLGIEWISKSSKGRSLSFPIIMPTTHVHYYKFGSQNSWKKYPSMTSIMRLNISY